jgi:hypothetical protein
MDMKEIKVKALPGEQIAILATVTAVQIEEGGAVRYFVKRLPDADIEEFIDDDSVVAYEVPKPEKVKREKVKTTLPEIPKKRPGRPKKATVEGTMAKLARMKQEETDKALDEMEKARENDAN